MSRLACVGFMLVALGLWASLLPGHRYEAVSSGEPDGDVLIAWPGWSIQQDLGSLGGTVGTFRIWVSTDPSAFRDQTLNASLIDASSREVLRQTLITVSRRYVPALHTVAFPSYVALPNQRLMLQLGIPESQARYVIYRLAHAAPTRANIMLNGVPDSGNGPLAYAHVRSGSGFRAALDGEMSSRVRLVLALVLVALAALLHPRVAGILGRVTSGVRCKAGQLSAWARRVVAIDAGRTAGDSPSRLLRVLEPPWYSWPAAAAPVLHYLTSNPLHFTASEAIVPLAVVLAVVTVLVVGLRHWLGDWHRPAAVCAVVIVVVFGYGHVSGIVDGRLDDRVMFSLAVVLATVLVVLIVRVGISVRRVTPFLNLTAAILLVFPVASLVTQEATAHGRTLPQRSAGLDEVAAEIVPPSVPAVIDRRPDIYYIVLDSYSRNDALLDRHRFDNSDFVLELEPRGFYVASKATSNYVASIHSLPSSLNLSYLDELGDRTPASRDDLIDLARNNLLTTILKNLGYTYIHLDSGYAATGTSPLADRLVTFTPSGTLIHTGFDGDSRSQPSSAGSLLSERFIRGLVNTTILSSAFGEHFILGGSAPFEWWSPYRTLGMFEFLSGEIDGEDPKFIFAHILKPGAEGGIRTRTSRSSQPPEDCVSTNFTTSARLVAEAGFEPAAKGL